MRRFMLLPLLVLGLALGGCGGDDFESLLDDLDQSLDDIQTELGDHEDAVIREGDLGDIEALEDDHIGWMRERHGELNALVRDMEGCGHDPSRDQDRSRLGDRDMLRGQVRDFDASLDEHQQNTLGLASLDEAALEEARYQARIGAVISEMRMSHGRLGQNPEAFDCDR